MKPKLVHVIGAGLSGLAAGVRLPKMGVPVALYEATSHAGGRCRSYHDPVLGRVIDNGNHLLLSGNRAALDYVRTIGAEDRLLGPETADFDFYDLASGAHWTLKLGAGRLPLWVFSASARVPGTRLADYLAPAKLLWRPAAKTVGAQIACSGPLYDRLLEPMLVACLNTTPPEASAELAAAVIRETVAAGGQACRPLVARDGLSAALVDPALRFIQEKGGAVHFGQKLSSIRLGLSRASALVFGETEIPLSPDEAIILAVPPDQAAKLLPGLITPDDYRAIANVHFLADAPSMAPITGVLGGLTQWIFAFPGRLSVTISAADHLMKVPREKLAADVWAEVAQIAGLPERLPPWQVVRERRATFAAVPAQEKRRPGAETGWGNVFLAGDWTATGLPPTIEGAVRSGNKAAALATATATA